MYIECKGNWLNHINNALGKYNNRVHGTTKMKPFEMSFCAASSIAPRVAPRAASNTAIPKDNLIPKDKIKLPKFPPKFQVGDFVRVPDERNSFRKVILQLGIENFSKYTKLIQQTQ